MPVITKNISRTIITRVFREICFGDVIYDPRGQHGPLSQGDYQLVLLIDGGLDLRLDGTWLHVPQGHVVLCRPGDQLLYLFEREKTTRHQWCTSPASLLSISLLEKLGKVGGIVPIPEILHTILWAGLQNEGAEPLHFPLHKALAESAFEAFWIARNAGEKSQSTAVESLRRVQRFIHEHHADNLSLSDLAKQGNVTPNHLIRLFREQLSETPVDYLWRIRVEQGATWLKETGLGISEIAYRAGFKNVFHFSRRFKQRFGSSPRSFRQVPAKARPKGKKLLPAKGAKGRERKNPN